MGRVHRTVTAVAAGCALLGAAGLWGTADAGTPTKKATKHTEATKHTDATKHTESSKHTEANGTLLHDGQSQYPRMIRLSHSGSANGRILASVTGKMKDSDVQGGLVFRSDDDGKSFHRTADATNPPETAGHDAYSGSLYELPRKVGDMPAGTVLFAASVDNGAPKETRQVRQRVWRSDDHGRTWDHLSDMAVAPNHEQAWEPELSITGDGRLAGYYSDESEKAKYDQKLVKTVSSDGKHWSEPENLVVHAKQSVRPGMAIVRRLPDGSFFLAYEVCNNDLKHQCNIYYRKSKDGWDWGDPSDLGTLVRTPDGKYGLHTPNVAWSPKPEPNGTLLIVPEMLVNEDGSLAPGNGKTILTNRDLGKGPWHEQPAPVKVDDITKSSCKNFSSSLLPSPDGTKVLEMATDYFAKDDCRSYFATGSLSTSSH